MIIIKKIPAHLVESVWVSDNKFSLYNFYSAIADYIGIKYDPNEYSFDCTHINISPEIEEEWIAGFKKRYPEKNLGELMMVLLMSGPKATMDSDYRSANYIGVDYPKKEFFMEPFYVEIDEHFVKEEVAS